MAQIREFRGLRPEGDTASKISSLPYDVFSVEEARAEVDSRPLSFLRITRPEVDLPSGCDVYNESVYFNGRQNLEEYITRGFLHQDAEPCLYLYTLIMNGRTQTGLVATVSIDDYVNGIVKKHELTREDKEKDRIRHLDALNANTGLVYLFYKEDADKSVFSKFLGVEPVYDFTAQGGVRHIFRVIEDEAAIAEIKNAMSGRDLYIADGHHRAASAVNVGLSRRSKNKNHTGKENYNYFLSVIFPHNELKIMPYNRAVADLNGLTEDGFISEISKNFTVEETGVKIPETIHDISMLLNGKWHTIRPKLKISGDPLEELDVKILQDNILAPVLGIGDPRKDKRIEFIGGIRGTDELERLVSSGSFKVAFSMYPTGIEQLISVSDAGKLMPPKSTWFEPKLRDGLVVYHL